MTSQSPKTVYLKDYAPPSHLIDTAQLHVELGDDDAVVRAVLAVRRNPSAPDQQSPLVLHGSNRPLEALLVDGEPVGSNTYQLDNEQLTFFSLPESCTIETQTRLRPDLNTNLEGLYRSGENLCTQCEAEGFRRITWFLDRPDVLARYTTTIVADRARYPVLLSNGNPIARGMGESNRHWVTWEDPYPKPAYLFALVAGDLSCVEDEFTTRSGRKVNLQIYVEHHNADKCAHAMQSLQKAMRWDEERFGLEYDLDTYMVVAVDDFNMGAMENKGLNVFNSKYVLARPETATDGDFQGIESVVAHEYFHNWTGNRVTCRDWFQLSLKEGLTVFRDQEFSSDVGSRAVKRIQDVRLLRNNQFPEDAGPMAHSVRPDSYMEISNFYTATVYNKGAELIRMIQTMVGREAFRRGMDLYIRRFDGQAVTTEDFVQAMEEATGADLRQFRRWYSQAGTPEINARGSYDKATQSYTLALKQSCGPSPGQADKEPFHVPLSIGLLDRSGHEIPLYMAGERETGGKTTRVLHLRKAEQRFRFVGVPEPPAPSVARGFSAPVKLRMERPDDELTFLMAHDSDPVNRWDAGQELATRIMLDLIAEHHAGRPLKLKEHFAEVYGRILGDRALNPALASELLSLPSEIWLGQQTEPIHVDAIHRVRQFVRQGLAREHQAGFLDCYHRSRDPHPYSFSHSGAGRRALKNRCLSYLTELDEPSTLELAMKQFRDADNMTDVLAALECLANTDGPQREEGLAAFFARWQRDPLVLDKWFTIQAASRLPDTLARVESLTAHPAFEIRNPNRVLALIGAFCHGNQVRFHDSTGAGYRFLVDRVLELDSLNPQTAARLLGAMNRWRRFHGPHREKMRSQLERVIASPQLSHDTFEIASKALSG